MELISREEAVSILEDMYDRADSIHESTDGDDWAWEEMKALQFAIDTIRERKEGEWIHDIHYGLKLPEHRCSICGEWEYSDTESNFCPNCGARMKGE